MKGYFELSLKVIDSGIAFDTRNQSTQIKDICFLKQERAKKYVLMSSSSWVGRGEMGIAKVFRKLWEKSE